ncbi:hypothetical protein [Dinoroseobacter sp. S375]|uniref:hypothetical protein n=1 Tax=Dinoroseobacter sp. S375 TaxID=3415136 RepID=UPI003C7D45A6
MTPGFGLRLCLGSVRGLALRGTFAGGLRGTFAGSLRGTFGAGLCGGARRLSLGRLGFLLGGGLRRLGLCRASLPCGHGFGSGLGGCRLLRRGLALRAGRGGFDGI